MGIKLPKELKDFFELNNIYINIKDLDVYEVENSVVITGVLLDKDSDNVLIQWGKNNNGYDLMGTLIDDLLKSNLIY